MLRLDLKDHAQRFIKHMHPKHADQVARKIYSLLQNPYPPDTKKLKGMEFFRVDSGEYRIAYRVEKGQTVLSVYLVGKRNDDEIYRRLKRLEQ